MSEHKPTRGVPVELDRTRYLRYSMATMAEIDEEFGGLSKAKGIRASIKVITLGLKGDDPDITEEQVAELVDGQNLATVMEAVAEAFGGEPEEVKKQLSELRSSGETNTDSVTTEEAVEEGNAEAAT